MTRTRKGSKREALPPLQTLSRLTFRLHSSLSLSPPWPVGLLESAGCSAGATGGAEDGWYAAGGKAGRATCSRRWRTSARLTGWPLRTPSRSRSWTMSVFGLGVGAACPAGQEFLGLFPLSHRHQHLRFYEKNQNYRLSPETNPRRCLACFLLDFRFFFWG